MCSFWGQAVFRCNFMLLLWGAGDVCKSTCCSWPKQGWSTQFCGGCCVVGVVLAVSMDCRDWEQLGSVPDRAVTGRTQTWRWCWDLAVKVCDTKLSKLCVELFFMSKWCLGGRWLSPLARLPVVMPSFLPPLFSPLLPVNCQLCGTIPAFLMRSRRLA